MEATEAMGKRIGIDLGTNNSVVAVMDGDKPAVIPNAEGSRTTPAVVTVCKPWTHLVSKILPAPLRRLADGLSRSTTGQVLVGEKAKRRAIGNPDRTVTSTKRRLGTDHRVTIGEIVASSEEIAGWILRKLKQDAEAYLNEEVEEAVITVPASFNDSERRAIEDAGRLAGLDVARTVDEPAAAAMAYGLHKQKQPVTVAVFDLGGATFEITLLDVEDGVFDVKTTARRSQIGGDDWDRRIVEYIAEEFRKEHGIDLRQETMALQRLKAAAEEAKIELSQDERANIKLPFIAVGTQGSTDIRGPRPKHLDVSLTRTKLEELTEDLPEQCMVPCRQAMADAGLPTGDIDRVLLVGGTTHMPQVRELAKRFFDKDPTMEINPDECVARGAAVATEATPTNGAGRPEM